MKFVVVMLEMIVVMFWCLEIIWLCVCRFSRFLPKCEVDVVVLNVSYCVVVMVVFSLLSAWCCCSRKWTISDGF